MEAHVQCHENVFLAGEVEIERRLGHPDLLRDLQDALAAFRLGAGTLIISFSR
jgi:hypothetical protein